jgi:hypothetical protein
MAIATSIETTGERRDQWRRLEKHWRDSLEEAIRDPRTSALDIGDEEELKDALRTYSIDENGGNALDSLSPAIDSLHPFWEAVGSAATYDQVSRLVWSGLFAVIEVCSGFSERTSPSVLTPGILE